MKRIVQLTLAALLLSPQLAQASIFTALIGWLPSRLNSEAVAGRNLERVHRPMPATRGTSFVVSTIDADVIAKFREAWIRTSNGTTSTESVVLIQRASDDRFTAKLLSNTNQYKCFTFIWEPGTVGILHTHPNSSPPKPQDDDIKVADKYGVPIFTLTIRGVFVYDPMTQKITKLIDGFTWTQPDVWAKVRAQLAP